MVKQLKYIGANSLFALFVFLLLPFVANAETLMAPDKEGEVISWLTQQYKEYWLNEDIHRTETMNEKYLTPAMLAKVYRAST